MKSLKVADNMESKQSQRHGAVKGTSGSQIWVISKLSSPIPSPLFRAHYSAPIGRFAFRPPALSDGSTL